MESTIILMQLFSQHRGLALSTIGQRSVLSSTVFDRLQEGKVTFATALRIDAWLSDHWPEDLPWPEDIPRPSPLRGEGKDAA